MRQTSAVLERKLFLLKASNSSFLLALTSLALLMLLRPNLWTEQVIVDGNYYAMLMQNGPSKILHFEPNSGYIWTRMIFVLPGWLLTNIMGIEAGYQAYRLVLILVSSYAIIRLLDSVSGSLGKIAGALVVISNPLFLTMVTNDNHYAITLPTTLVSLAAAAQMIQRPRIEKSGLLATLIFGVSNGILIASGTGIPQSILMILLVNLFLIKQIDVQQLLKSISIQFLLITTVILMLNVISFWQVDRFDAFQTILKFASDLHESGIWRYWKSENLNWLHQATSLIALLVYLMLGIYNLIAFKDKSFSNTNAFLFLVYCSHLSYAIFAQFIDKNSMGLLEIWFHVGIAATAGLAILSISISSLFVGNLRLVYFFAFYCLLYFAYHYPQSDRFISSTVVLLSVSISLALLVASLNSNLGLKTISVVVAIIFSTFMLHSHPNRAAPDSANIAGPKYWETYQPIVDHKKRWVQSASFAKWVLSKPQNDDIQIKTWLLPNIDDAGTVTQFGLNSWSAAGMLLWGQSDTSIRDVPFPVAEDFSIPQSEIDRLNLDDKVVVVIVSESRIAVEVARDYIDSSNLNKVELCEEFSQSQPIVYGCVY